MSPDAPDEVSLTAVHPQAAHAAMPVSLPNAYPMAVPNEGFRLYDGPVTLTIDGSSCSGQGQIGIRWLPSASLHYDVQTTVGLALNPLITEANLHLDDVGTDVTIYVESQTLSFTAGQATVPLHLTGRINEHCRTGFGTALQNVAFSVPNGDLILGSRVRYETADPNKFSSQTARHEFAFGDYSVILEIVENARSLSEALGKQGGFALTYVGRIMRTDGAMFSGDDADQTLTALGYMLSFAWGRWTFPILLKGYDVEGECIWQDWRMTRLDSWKSRTTWLSSARDTVFSDLAPGYAALYYNADWSEALRIITHWYLDSLAADVVETSLVLAQCGLELLTWIYFKVDTRNVAPANFDGLQAEGKIKAMLRVASVTTNIPSHLSNLTNVATSYPGQDGLGMFILLRNGAVHANRLPNLLAAPVGARLEARELGLYYYELLMLFVMGYHEGFRNRVGVNHWSSAEEGVPW